MEYCVTVKILLPFPDLVNINIYVAYVMFQVPIKWPTSRDEVWKANIPHTHLAHEKSDQNWMVVKGEKIVFPGGGTHFHYGADKYIASIANVRRPLAYKLSFTKYLFHVL